MGRRLPIQALCTLLFAVSTVVAADASHVNVASATQQVQVAEATVVAQINAVRKTFHLQPAVLTTAYNGEAIAAARGMRDPFTTSLPRGTLSEDGVWGEYSGRRVSSLSSATIVHLWVYDDGWRGSATINGDCTSSTAPGCNGHRRAILSKPPARGAKLLVDAAAYVTTRGGYPTLSVAALLLWKV